MFWGGGPVHVHPVVGFVLAFIGSCFVLLKSRVEPKN